MIGDTFTPQIARFQEAARLYQHINAGELFTRLAEIFRKECALLRDYENGNYSSYVSASREVDVNIENLRLQLSTLDALDMVEWKSNLVNYQVEKNPDPISEPQFTFGYESPSQGIVDDLHMSSATLFCDKLKYLAPLIAEKLKNLSETCDCLIDNVIDNYIKEWKYNQQKYGSSDFSIYGADLEKFQSWCSGIAQILTIIQRSIDSIQSNLQEIPGSENLARLMMTLRQSSSNSLIKLVRGSVIIENQPPQVIKTNTK